MKRLLILPAVLVVLLLLLVAGAEYLVRYALQPEAAMRHKHERVDADLARDYPFLTAWRDSLDRHHLLRDTTIFGDAGERMHALWIAAPRPTDRTAVLVHGYTDEALRMLPLGYLYNHDLGYNVLLPDLHYHGTSEGRAIRMGWQDRTDVMRWMAVANEIFGRPTAEHPEGGTRMVAHGISMGAATVMMLAGEAQPDYVRCWVEDCGYTDVWEQFAKELKEQFGLPAFPLLHLASGICRMRYGWSFGEASALRQLPHATLPMLFIHGDSDTFVPTEMVYRLYEAKPEPKELWVVPGTKHARSYRNERAAYTERVRAFLDRHIGE